MPYPQDLVGKYINFRVDPGGTLSAAIAALMVNGVLPGQTSAASAGVYTSGAAALIGAHRAPGALQFASTSVPWSFTFLKYIAGAVTTAPLLGGVLTGPMSGCYLCSYSHAGQPHLAHIGTANATDSAESIAVKAAWRTFVARTDVGQVSGGSPFDYFTTAEFQASMLSPSGIPLVAGYFAGGSAYALLLAPVPASMTPPVPLLKVAAVKTMTLQPWATIAALRTFRD